MGITLADNPKMNSITREELMTLEQPRAATIREQFAMAALTGLLASGVQLDNPEDYAKAAWRHADLALKHRPRPKVAAP